MHNITIKNIPNDLYKKIKLTAQENRRSINNEIISRLDHALKSTRIEANSFIKKIEDFQKNLNMPSLTEDILKEAKEKGRL